MFTKHKVFFLYIEIVYDADVGSTEPTASVTTTTMTATTAVKYHTPYIICHFHVNIRVFFVLCWKWNERARWYEYTCVFVQVLKKNQQKKNYAKQIGDDVICTKYEHTLGINLLFKLALRKISWIENMNCCFYCCLRLLNVPDKTMCVYVLIVVLIYYLMNTHKHTHTHSVQSRNNKVKLSLSIFIRFSLTISVIFNIRDIF